MALRISARILSDLLRSSGIHLISRGRGSRSTLCETEALFSGDDGDDTKAQNGLLALLPLAEVAEAAEPLRLEVGEDIA